MNKIVVYSSDKKFNRHIKPVSAITRKVFLLLKKDKISVDIFLIDDGRMRSINRKYRHKNKTTNVLSFCEPKDFVSRPSKNKYLGEIYISPDFIEKKGQDVRLMIVHGALHLLGYDHIKESDRRKMEKKEALILTRI